jgi:hypothetical protein
MMSIIIIQISQASYDGSQSMMNEWDGKDDDDPD